MSLQVINWFNPDKHHGVKKLLIHEWETGNGYEDIATQAKEMGFYLPEDQLDLFMKLLDSQVDLDIGKRQAEYKSPAEIPEQPNWPFDSTIEVPK